MGIRPLIGVIAAATCAGTWAQAVPAPECAADFYVAPGGRDSNPGTAGEPFATLVRARDAVRQKVAAGLDRDVLVRIRGGVYRQAETLVFGPEDSGTAEHSIIYAALPAENVVISAGRTVGPPQRRADDHRLEKGRGPIWTVEVPEVKAGKWYFRQLFVNGRRAVRAGRRMRASGGRLRPGKNSDANDATITLGVDHPIRAWRNVRTSR